MLIVRIQNPKYRMLGLFLVKDMYLEKEPFFLPLKEPFSLFGRNTWETFWNEKNIFDSFLSYDRFCSQFSSVLGPI